MLSLEGKKLGNYDIIRRIRAGGMGAVYEGRQRTAFGRRVAIKVILGDYAKDQDMRRRFAREAKTIARLHHPHILPLIEFGDAQGTLYLVMPFIDGGTLTSHLRRNLPELGEVSALYQQILDAVEHAHEQGLIHRDIKSSNVLLELRRNAAPYAYLADFGLVRTMRPDSHTRVGRPIPLEQVPGTPHYMAPEQTMGIVTPLTDIYALGILLYQMLTGNLPYNDPDEVRVIKMQLYDPIPRPSTIDPSIPQELDEVVQTAMAKQPDERYQSVAELRQAFLDALKGPARFLTISQENEVIQKTVSTPDETDIEDVVVWEEEKTVPLKRSIEPPQPIIMQEKARVTRDLRQIGLERANRFHTTSATYHPQQRAAIPLTRTTEEPLAQLPDPTQRKKRSRLPFFFFLIIIFVVTIFITTKVPDMNLLIADLPFINTSNQATVAISAKSYSLTNTFLLVGNPKTKNANPQTHTLPDHFYQDHISNTVTVTTTGKGQMSGTTAQGTIVITNTSPTQQFISKGQEFFTAANISFHSLEDATVPAEQLNKAGEAYISVEADQAGTGGNIAAGTFDGAACCNSQMLTASNIEAFTGGSDATTTHFVTQNDIDSTKNSQAQQLEQQLSPRLLKQLKAGEVVAGQIHYTVSVSTNMPVNSQATSVQVTTQVQGSISAYENKVAEQMAMVLLNNQAQNKYGSAYHLESQQNIVGAPGIKNGDNGTIYLSMTVHGIWIYTLSDTQINQWRTQIKGETSSAASTYLKQQPGVANVDIHLAFGSTHLPGSQDAILITITENSAS